MFVIGCTHFILEIVSVTQNAYLCNKLLRHLFLGLDVFAENLRELLLTLPCRNSVVMGLDPGFKHGCKMAVIDANGNVLQTGVVYPRVQDLSVKDETFLIESIEKFKVV